jgi:triosephosphate isomerase
MIIVFNWKDKTPDNYHEVFASYQKIAQNFFLIVCPNNDFFKIKINQFSKINIKYCLQNTDMEILQSEFSQNFDYVMTNHQRFKENLLDSIKIQKIINFNKIPIICFSSIDEIDKIKNTEAIWAFEPDKNIGSTTTLDLNEISSELTKISKLKLKGKLLYGGGVRTDNFIEFYQKIGNLVDGLLIGDKSINPQFLKIFDKLLVNYL